MAVGTHLCLVRAGPWAGIVGRLAGWGGRTADGVRHVAAKGDAAQALGRNRLLLHVDRLAVVVVGAHVNGAARPRGANAVAGGIAVFCQHVHVVSKRLPVVRHEVAGDVSFIVQRGRFLVGLLGQVAAKAAWVPRTVAGDAVHEVVAVGARLRLDCTAPLNRSILGPSHRLCKC